VIESLRLERIAIVEEAELEFGHGLNVLTGETGAGKSIVLGALALLVGGRAPSEVLREGADDGAVEAVFDTRALPELEAELDERGLRAEGHALGVRRTLRRTGRGRTRIAGELVPASLLAELFAGRLEISSQHSSQALLRLESHGRMLDAAGDLWDDRATVEQAVRQARRLDAELVELRQKAEERARRRDFLDFQLQEIDEVGLEEGELAVLEARHARLAHAGRLRDEAAAALAALARDPSGSESEPALDGVQRAGGLIDGIAELDGALAPLAERLGASELQDVARELERYVDGLDVEPSDLSRVEDRLAQIERLRRKYGRSEDEIRGFRAEVAAELAAVEGADARAGQIEEERAGCVASLAVASKKLSRGRARAARTLARQVERSLRELGMPNACFEVALEPVTDAGELGCGPSGAEVPEFRFSANGGERARSLQRVASGGELSRILLALKNALRRAGSGMVLVFDEVDAGIGGSTAERVGRLLAQLAGHHQVLCITHLPQIAAFADVHFRVEKAESKRSTTARVVRLEGDARVDEIARMAGGASISDATRAHARELLRSSRSD